MQPAQVEKPKRSRGKKAKDGTGTEPAAQSTTLVVTRSAMKVAAKTSTTLVSVDVGGPFAVPSIMLAIASQSEANCSFFAEEEGCGTKCERYILPISILIENMVMEDLIKVY